ncbi:MAG: UbiA prenyltransferase family protein [Thermoplasmata archaeon]|nr:MAG: UbiA prenyltransferase family protein [Thermoplasmata archaeon]
MEPKISVQNASDVDMKKNKKMETAMQILYGGGIPQGAGLKNKMLALICLQRPLVAIMGPLMFFAGAALALKGLPSWESFILGFIAVYMLTSAEHTIDDFIDKEIDKVKWPSRPLPTETIPRKVGGVYGALLGSLGILISYLIFNWQLVIIELVALGFGTAYPFLRDRIGYLVLPGIPALIGIGGWAAYSPDTLFTSPVPWILYLVFAAWQAFHILTLPWALTQAKIFIVRPKPRTVAEISMIFSVITLALAIFLSLYIENALIFIITMIVISLLFWITAIPLIREPTNTENSHRAVVVATNYNIIMCAVLMLTVI